MKHLLIILFLSLGLLSCQSQTLVQENLGGWSGELPAADAFVFKILLNKTSPTAYTVTFQGKQKSVTLPLENRSEGKFIVRYDQQLSFHLEVSSGVPIAFIETGNHLSYVDLVASKKDQWESTWNLFTSSNFDPTLYLSLDRQGKTSFYASTFFQSPVMHYMLGEGFQESGGTFSFRDARSGINFTGELNTARIDLTMAFLSERITFPLFPTDCKRPSNYTPRAGFFAHCAGSNSSNLLTLC